MPTCKECKGEYSSSQRCWCKQGWSEQPWRQASWSQRSLKHPRTPKEQDAAAWTQRSELTLAKGILDFVNSKTKEVGKDSGQVPLPVWLVPVLEHVAETTNALQHAIHEDKPLPERLAIWTNKRDRKEKRVAECKEAHDAAVAKAQETAAALQIAQEEHTEAFHRVQGLLEEMADNLIIRNAQAGSDIVVDKDLVVKNLFLQGFTAAMIKDTMGLKELPENPAIGSFGAPPPPPDAIPAPLAGATRAGGMAKMEDRNRAAEAESSRLRGFQQLAEERAKVEAFQAQCQESMALLAEAKELGRAQEPAPQVAVDTVPLPDCGTATGHSDQASPTVPDVCKATFCCNEDRGVNDCPGSDESTVLDASQGDEVSSQEDASEQNNAPHFCPRLPGHWDLRERLKAISAARDLRERLEEIGVEL